MAEFLTVSEVAEELGVSPGTIRNWINAGLIKAHRVYSRGMFLIKPEDVEKAIDKGTILPRENREDYGDDEE